jgi:hypothetical protein
VDFDGLLGRSKLVGDLLVQEACDNPLHYLELPWRQKIQARPRSSPFCAGLSCVCGSSERQEHGRKKLIFVDWFYKEVDRARLHRPSASRDIPVTSKKDNLFATLRQRLLKLQTVEVWHANIEYQARWSLVEGAPKERFRRTESLDRQPRRTEKASETASDGFIIIDDEYQRIAGRLGNQ